MYWIWTDVEIHFPILEKVKYATFINPCWFCRTGETDGRTNRWMGGKTHRQPD